jgi:VanZ family protein
VTDPKSDPSRWRGFALHVLPAVVYVVALFYGGSLTSAKLPRVDVSDKLVHLVAFGILQLLAFRAMRFQWPRQGLKWQLVASILTTSAIGAALEVYQLFIQYRSAEVLDWVADTVGAMLAGGILFLALRGAREVEAPPLSQRDRTEPAG